MGFMMRIYTITAFCALGLLFNLETCAGELSNKMFYAEIMVEEGAIQNISNLFTTLQAINITVDNSLLIISQFSITTVCEIRGNKTICKCSDGYIWSGAVCDSQPDCCNQIECSVKTSQPTPMCLPKTRVIISGSATFPDAYNSLYSNTGSPEYKAFTSTKTEELKQVYSTFSGFDSLVITGIRQGSVIVDFLMTVNAPLNSSQLESKTNTLQTSMNATFQLTTTGLVQIYAPNETICYDSTQQLSCTMNDPSFDSCSWKLTAGNNVYALVNGTEVLVEPSCSLTLLKTSQIWQGTYNCSFSKGFITHTASATLDIALLPENIQILSGPQYPDCSVDEEKSLQVNVTCTIKNSTENYTMSWSFVGTSGGLNSSTNANGFISNSVIVSVQCKSQSDIIVTCQYINRKSQQESANLTLPVIYMGTPVCQANGDWPKAKASTTAQLACIGERVGMRTRPCLSTGSWGIETSPCVNRDLNNILQDTYSLLKGRGSPESIASDIFGRLKNSTNSTVSINTYANINASVTILQNMNNASANVTLGQIILPDLLASSNNILSISLKNSWTELTSAQSKNSSLSEQYLMSMEGLITKTHINISESLPRCKYANVELVSQAAEKNSSIKVLNASIILPEGIVKAVAFSTLSELLPTNEDTTTNSIILSVTLQNSTLKNDISITFPLINSRPRNYEIDCVYWDFTSSQFSGNGCDWTYTGVNTEAVCTCNHLTSFATLMSKHPISLKFQDEITYVGLGASVCSLTLCLIIEFLVWNTVVKSNISHFRHTALVNISLCLLLADCSFLASSFLSINHSNWCPYLVIIKHYCYLAMFFWMLCLSMMLLHQLMFVFHQLRKKVYLTFSICLGYICPLFIVILTFIAYQNGKENYYYSSETCWLVYEGTLKGSIYAFIFPVLIIVVINFLSMMVVITKLLRPQVSDGSKADEKDITKSILKAVVFLTPIFGVTWILGFFVLTIDLTEGPLAFFINYAFIIVNSFQGVLILITGCFGEKKVRDALLKYFISTPPKPTKNESSTKVVSIIKK
ncbi:adhesion G-protein coupled receptor F1 [Scleropages formosus]|uniref:adhesion G-protein coupled receptor F1 n=1 Tax=Scleropages formosus TaxID=113540 RepID=UPI0010FA7196|nr:adhesion G-protein coupled receptor F1-like [Scleropages formosus]